VLAVRAQAPVGHFGLFDLEAPGERRLQAGGLVLGDLDVADLAALAAHEMVVAVADARLVARVAARGLDAPGEADVGERVEHVVGGLRGQGANPAAGPGDDLVDLGMPALLEHVEHRESLPGDSQSMGSQ